jgi:hypothetical protein
MSESGIQKDSSDFSAGQRIRGVIVAGIVLVMSAFFSFELTRQAWTDTKLPVALRAFTLTISTLLFAFVAWFCGRLVVRRIRTGRFFLTRAEIRAKRAQARDRMGAGKPFWPQARFWLVGWILLAVLAAFGIGTLVAAVLVRDGGLTGSILLASLGLAFLILPGWYVVKAVRRKRKTGNFLPSQEEFDQTFAKCAQPKPLRQRILLAALYWTVALIFTGTALFRPTHDHPVFGSPWVLPAMWWAVAAVWTLQVFRPRASQCDLDSGLPPSIKPPAS